MKAVRVRRPGGPEQLWLGEWEDPAPKPDELLVRVRATALNRADILQRLGRYPPPDGASPILGLEMAGEVIAVGTAVTRWREGDRVCGLLAGGGYAELATIHEDMAIRMPDRFDFKDAAAIPEAFLTAYQALVLLGNLRPNTTVLIHAGASGVGTAAIQLAAARGATVIVTASAGKHLLCVNLGASFAIDYRSADFRIELERLTDSRGADLIIDFIGGPYLERNVAAMATDGTLIILGLMGGRGPAPLDLSAILRGRKTIVGSTLRNRGLEYKIGLTRRFTDECWSSLSEGQLIPVIDSCISWTQVADAHRRMEANENAGKIVMTVD